MNQCILIYRENHVEPKYYLKWKWQINIIKEGRREVELYIIWDNVDNFLIATLPFSLRQHPGQLKQETKVGEKDNELLLQLYLTFELTSGHHICIEDLVTAQ